MRRGFRDYTLRAGPKMIATHACASILFQTPLGRAMNLSAYQFILKRRARRSLHFLLASL
eukprot:CAMPEP_0114676570 /NCGR_PEP_ID=MMETSP0191-20121206/49401_1 /TAXON_ID=126664 /ORGANISM="Sorites sp." /LENGTH=59 /DNA_ID=CAMNT_0001947767 /DNA_START=74 /DNA_END=250 /DNA_ORIENTATION=-